MAKIPSARGTSLWVRKTAGATDNNFVQLKTDTQISWSLKRDQTAEDYRGATNKANYTGIPDITASLQISRVEEDEAYDLLIEAVDSGDDIDIQLRNADGVYLEGPFVLLDDTETYGLAESGKVALSMSAAGSVTLNRSGRAVTTGS